MDADFTGLGFDSYWGMKRCFHSSGRRFRYHPTNRKHCGIKDYGRLLYKCKINEVLSHLTSIYILATKVVPVEKHELDPVALVQRHQADQQQQDGAETSGQLHRVHQLG